MTNRLRVALLALLLAAACGAAPPSPIEPARVDVDRPPTRVEASPPVPADFQDEDSPPTRAEASPSVPADFQVEAGGGPVARWMAADTEFTRSRLEPREGASGEFDVVERVFVTDERGMMTGEPIRERRIAVPRARVAELHRLVVSRREALRRPCFDPSIRDGAIRRFTVRAEGETETYSCTNASTPDFEALSQSYFSLVRDALEPAP